MKAVYAILAALITVAMLPVQANTIDQLTRRVQGQRAFAQFDVIRRQQELRDSIFAETERRGDAR